MDITLLSAGWGLLGLWMVSRGHKMGWVVTAASQPFWALISIPAHQWGYVIASIAYFIISVHGYLHHDELPNR